MDNPGPQGTNPGDVGDPVTSHSAAPAEQNLTKVHDRIPLKTTDFLSASDVLNQAGMNPEHSFSNNMNSFLIFHQSFVPLSGRKIPTLCCPFQWYPNMFADIEIDNLMCQIIRVTGCTGLSVSKRITCKALAVCVCV